MLLKNWDKLPENMRNDKVRPYYDSLKKKSASLVAQKIFDFIVSLILIILLSPVILFLAIWIKSDSKGPVFYRQERITKYGKKFKIFKFRTMVTDADKIGTLVTLNNDSRITGVGAKIRKLRIDELPQLFNVFLGDMSFVGTRPEVGKYVDAYTDAMVATLLLPAGVTSLASIEFKDEDEIIEKYKENDISVDEIYITKVLSLKMEYNLKEIEEFGFFRNISMMLKTVFAVFK